MNDLRFLFDGLYLLAVLVTSPWWVWQSFRYGKYRRGWKSKWLGIVPRRDTSRPAIWVHAVSVGEVQVAATLVSAWKRRWPAHQFLITSTTDSGQALAQRRFPHDLVSYAPLDFSWAVGRALQTWQPTVILLVELELWPNLLTIAQRQHVPVCLVNGRLSEPSFRGYRRIRGLVRRWLAKLAVIAVQDASYAARFQALGATKDQVTVTGSVKFDGAEANRQNAATVSLRHRARIAETDVVFIAGSTQQPEEACAIDVYRELAPDFPALKLVVVPRHPERFSEVAELMTSLSLPFVRWTAYKDSPRQGDPPKVLLVDTIGELRDWWGIADLAFVGGSMSQRGGQNMIEPAAYGAAICFGPNTRNFADVVALFLSAKAATVVHDVHDLKQFVKEGLQHPSRRTALGRVAASVVDQHRGATERTLTAIERTLHPTHHRRLPQVAMTRRVTTDVESG